MAKAGQGIHQSKLRAPCDCVEASLTSKLSLPFLAGICDLSPWHFAVQFKATTGLSPANMCSADAWNSPSDSF